jgi:DNA polymerase III sliding clamp (beta) subunit (PCNA family)
MKLIIPRSEIKEAVAGLGRIVANKTTLPVLSCVKLDVNGAVTLTATDLEQSARYQFTGGTSTGTGSLVIPFQSLKDLAKGNDREQVEIETDTPESGTVINHVGSLAVKKTVYGTPLEEWPVVPDAPTTKPAEGFLETYRKLLPFTSDDPTRHMLGGICVDVTGKGTKPVTMVATDGRRLTCCNSMVLPLELTTVIPGNKFLGWTGLPADTQEIGIKMETVKEKEGRKTVERREVKGFGLKAGAWTYSCRTIDGSYPNWRQVLPDPEYCKDNRITLTDDDVDALRKILPTFPGHDQSTPSITLGTGPEGAVQIAGRAKDDKAESTLDLAGGSRFEGKSRICLNREYLLDALNAGFRSFMFTDSSSPIRGDDGKGGTHCLMPMRLEEPVQPVPETKDEAGTTTAEGEAPAIPEQADHTDNQGDGTQPEPETTEMESKTRRTHTMPEKNDTQTTTESSTLDKAIHAVETARAKLREGVSALVDVADALKAAAKEGKTQAADLEKARTTLQKLQAISL